MVITSVVVLQALENPDSLGGQFGLHLMIVSAWGSLRFEETFLEPKA